LPGALVELIELVELAEPVESIELVELMEESGDPDSGNSCHDFGLVSAMVFRGYSNLAGKEPADDPVDLLAPVDLADPVGLTAPVDLLVLVDLAGLAVPVGLADPVAPVGLVPEVVHWDGGHRD